MKLNAKKVATQYSAIIDGYHVQFGWYDSGRAFVAEDGKLMKAYKCYSFYVPSESKLPGKYFEYNSISYDKTLDGIVRFLRAKYCKEGGN